MYCCSIEKLQLAEAKDKGSFALPLYFGKANVPLYVIANMLCILCYSVSLVG
jgi:hypothetical protein